jgi:O-acetyl-ADP-ribose deacetylase (regulator of RNase III)
MAVGYTLFYSKNDETYKMLTYLQGDIFQSSAKVLVNPVNTAGVMGKGLALEFKKRYTAMFQEYRTLCENGQFQVGDLWLYKSPDKWILNFPTKRHWRDKSRLEDIETGLQRFVAIYQQEAITTIAFPKLGAGLGGLDWESQVRPLMEGYLAPLPIEISIYT